MEKDRIKKWIRIIAAFNLLITLVGIGFYILTVNGVIDETFTEFEVFDFYVSTLMGLVIFLGLWRLESWGWKSAIILIPLSWVFCLFELFVDYDEYIGLFIAPFLVIDALILRYLFKPHVCQFFNIISSPLLRFQWLVNALLLLALFLAVKDIFSGLVGLITVIAVILSLGTAKKHMEKLTKGKDLTSG
ncbi:MAG: hypothetical protein ACYSWP_22610 [Planctomycetota bacterium]|jgi:hypothetical protein